MMIEAQIGNTPTKFEVPDGATPDQIDEVVKHYQQTKSDNQGAWDKYGQPFVDTAKQGLSDAGDFASFGSYKNQTSAAETLSQKHKAGTADRHDYERAFMEGVANSPPGKLMGAVAGLVPEANIVTTALNKWINPAIVEKTGIDPTELQMLEMAAGGATALKGKAPTPISAAAIDTAKAAPGAVLSGAGKAVNAVMSPVSGLVKPIARGIIEADNPITGEPGLKTALASDTAAEGARLGDKLGVNFSAGELTGNPTAMGIEDALANSARYGGKFAEANEAKTNAIVSKFNETLDKISSNPSSRTDVGDRLSTAYNGTIDSLIKNRDAQASVDFKAATEGAGSRDQNILSNNFFRTLQELKDEGSARLLTSREELGAQLANKYLSRLSTKTKNGNTQADTISIYELQKGLSNFSKASKRPGNVLEDAKTAAMRSAYARLAGALQKDLDAEIANPKGDPARAAALKIARDNFAKSSNQIADIQKTALGKIIGNADHDSAGNLVVSPEKLADKFSAMEPTELKSTLDFLDKNHPDVANMARRYTLEKALRQAQEGKGQRGQGTTKDFAKAEFVKSLPDDAKLNALLKDPHAAADIRDISAAMNRLIDYGAAKKGSQTAQRTDILANIGKWGKGALYRAVVSDSLAEDLLNPSKRRQIAFEAKKIKPASQTNTKKAMP